MTKRKNPLKNYRGKSKYADLIKRTVPGCRGGFSYLKFISIFISIQRMMINTDKRKKWGKVPET